MLVLSSECHQNKENITNRFLQWAQGHDYQAHYFLGFTLTKMFCGQPLRLVWLMYVQKADLEKDIEFSGIENLNGF